MSCLWIVRQPHTQRPRIALAKRNRNWKTNNTKTKPSREADFHQAMPGPSSKPMYDDFLTGLGKAYKPEKIKGESDLIALGLRCVTTRRV